MDFNEYDNIIDNIEVNSPERPNTDENFANEVEYDDVVADSDDSMGSERAYPLDKNKLKKSSNVFYNPSTLKMGKVRKYKYTLKNIGSLYIATWTREEGEKDNDLSISSSSFKREYSKRKIKQFNYYQ
ncbi:hypothetical protein TpMuguga_04g02025 [Theileria parva strain Muguga]|uniref:uncharacterized protein n=1 Tax=Theileria parva strain Muguga TaxID=333668 RepID=UPI001C62401C|nr:uncharacterized protein TpMuguga_04g02025 [Theileria parva strain Muguga]KAF5153198.1 hypothetical protein TpMuguga_04g02025 [Theileria parva strain Muguga]